MIIVKLGRWLRHFTLQVMTTDAGPYSGGIAS
jgi:hypothetical protein